MAKGFEHIALIQDSRKKPEDLKNIEKALETSDDVLKELQPAKKDLDVLKSGATASEDEIKGSQHEVKISQDVSEKLDTSDYVSEESQSSIDNRIKILTDNLYLYISNYELKIINHSEPLPIREKYENQINNFIQDVVLKENFMMRYSISKGFNDADKYKSMRSIGFSDEDIKKIRQDISYITFEDVAAIYTRLTSAKSIGQFYSILGSYEQEQYLADKRRGLIK